MSLEILIFCSPGKGISLTSSGEKQYLFCSGATEMSNLRVPLMHLSLFRAVDGRFRSNKNL